MKKVVLLLVVVSFSLVFPEPVHSAEEVADGNSTLTDCSLALDMAQDKYVEHVIKGAETLPSSGQQTKAIQCMSYVIGFKDAIYVGEIFQEKNGKQPSICLPFNNLNNELAVRVVVKYLRDNPQLLSGPQSGLVFNAFFHAFPCGK
jgi:hypothetical protein